MWVGESLPTPACPGHSGYLPPFSLISHPFSSLSSLPGLLWIPPAPQPFSSRLYHLLFSLPRTLFPSTLHLLIQLQPSRRASFSLPASSQGSPILGSFSLCSLSPPPPQFLACCLAHIGCSVTIGWTEFKSNLLFCKLCYVVSSTLS